ncbi:bud emergence protein 1 [Boothiomyces sp. JEL0838]|nr:bud emergence protein 1 [Boothiomyces sp. JEL0838]
MNGMVGGFGGGAGADYSMFYQQQLKARKKELIAKKKAELLKLKQAEEEKTEATEQEISPPPAYNTVVGGALKNNSTLMPNNSIHRTSSQTSQRTNYFPTSKPTKPAEIDTSEKAHSQKTDSGVEISMEARNRLGGYVQSCELGVDDEWQFTIEVKLRSGGSHILFRKYDDLWDLHIDLMKNYPGESGANGTPRSIPFLDPPAHNMALQEALRRRKVMNFYIQEIMFLSLLGVGKDPINNFFALRDGDLNCKNKALSGSSNAIMDLLNDLDLTKEITVVISDGKKTASFTTPVETDLDTLFESARKAFKEPFSKLKYRNEMGEKIVLQSDNELRLLINYRNRLSLSTA